MTQQLKIEFPLLLKDKLDDFYEKYNHRKFVHPDPLEFLYHYDKPEDIEIAGIVASSLAYGRVAQILKSVESVLENMNPSPSVFLQNVSENSLVKIFSNFRHRFSGANELASFLFGIGRVTEQYGSLEKCFKKNLNSEDETFLPALSFFVDELIKNGAGKVGHLAALPERGSACKRWFLFLRWMIRKDAVDPGCWELPSDKLIIPLDTHIHRICSRLGMTQRKQANMKTALEITSVFRSIRCDDPVKYDFALTRLGIRNDTDIEAFFKKL
ncbi:TIGR02757 family protein [Candidatus Magnetomoraceae bacterium gMMP-1]